MSKKGGKADSLAAARAAKAKAVTLVAAVAEVQGVGITRVDGVYAVKVNVLEEVEGLGALPDTIDGVPLVVKVTGSVRKQ